MRASILSRRLADRALPVCRHYLSNGKQSGRYWCVGDLNNNKGHSLYVRLAPPGRVGGWCDAATGAYGDLLDLIQQRLLLPDLCSAMVEAERFLGITPDNTQRLKSGRDTIVLAQRMFDVAQPIVGTIAERYLLSRLSSRHCGHIVTLANETSAIFGGQGATLRFLPNAWFSRKDRKPALLVAVRDNSGNLTGVSRTFLTADGQKVERRALGKINSYAVRIGELNPRTLLVGEGLETVLSFRVKYPNLALSATLGAAHLAAFKPPSTVTHLIIAADKDATGKAAAQRLRDRVQEQGVIAQTLLPKKADFNADLLTCGPGALPDF